MALVIEDGSEVSGANSYVTATEWDTWATARGITHSHSSAQIEKYILRAMDYFENLNFMGRKATDTQALQWPRTEVVIDTYSVDSDEIPSEVKKAIYELVKTESDSDSYMKPLERHTTKEKIGEIEITYKDSASMRRSTPAVGIALRKIIKPLYEVSRS